MVADADKHRDDDSETLERHQARHGLESFLTHLRAALANKAHPGAAQISAAERKTAQAASDAAAAWLGKNQEAKREAYEAKQAEVEAQAQAFVDMFQNEEGDADNKADGGAAAQAPAGLGTTSAGVSVSSGVASAAATLATSGDLD